MAKKVVQKPVEKPNEAPPSPPLSSSATEEKRYFVAKGYSMTTLRGGVEEGEEVFPWFFAGGQKTIGDFVKKGCVVEK